MAKQLKHPSAESAWQTNFRAHSLKVGFQLFLSKPMLEMLCAVADGVLWDRSMVLGGIHFSDNWIASQSALQKRGLIVRKTDDEFVAEYPNFCKRGDDTPKGEWCRWKLTPAGKAVVELVVIAGLFVEADAAMSKKSRTRGA